MPLGACLLPPASAVAAAGTAAEMVTPGGELAFVRAMIADSRRLRGRVHWYSSMCGKKASMKVLRQELHSAGALPGWGVWTERARLPGCAC